MPEPASFEIKQDLEAFLERGGISHVHVAGGSTAPPLLAYLVSFPRLSIYLTGDDEMEIEQHGKTCHTEVKAGEAVFVPPNCWNKPAWSRRAKVLTLLFGKRQTGISLVSSNERGEPASAIKTHFHRPIDGPIPGILSALMNVSAKPVTRDPRRSSIGDVPASSQTNPTPRLLVEALLHSCLHLLGENTAHTGGKADKTFQNICMYLQENFQFPLARDSVADHFRLSPNHVSRLFRNEGYMRFTDYLTWVRLDRAKYMLRHHDRTLSEVARSCGFNDIGYFCRVFKRKTKLTPTAYRLQKSAEADEG